MQDGKVQWEYQGKEGGLNSMLQKIAYSMGKLDAITAKYEARADKAFSNTTKRVNLAVTAADKMGVAFTKASVPVDKLNLKFADMPGKIQAVEREADKLREKLHKATSLDDIVKYNQQLETTTRKLQGLRQLGTGPTFAQQKSMAYINRVGGTRVGDAIEMLPGNLGMLGGMASNPYVLAGAAVAGTVALANSTANKSLDWGRRMGKINTTAQLSPEELQKLSDDLLKSGRDYVNGPITDVADAYEKIISQTNDAITANRILKYSIKGSRAGFADITTVGTAITSVLENTKDQGSTPAQVLDVLMKAKKVGAGEFGDFARYIPQQIASSQGTGFNYKDVAALYAFTTTKMPNADVANTLVDNLIGQFKTPESRKRMKSVGISPFDDKGQFQGLEKVLRDINNKYKAESRRSPEAGLDFLTKVTQDRQAGAQLGMLMSDFDKLTATLHDVRKAAGEADRALKFGDYGATKIEEANRKWEELAIKIGNLTAPLKIAFYDTVGNAIDNPGKTAFNYATYALPFVFGPARAAYAGYEKLTGNNDNTVPVGMLGGGLSSIGNKLKSKLTPRISDLSGNKSKSLDNASEDVNKVTSGTSMLKSVVVNIGVVKAADTINTITKAGEVQQVEGSLTELLVREIYGAEKIVGR